MNEDRATNAAIVALFILCVLVILGIYMLPAAWPQASHNPPPLPTYYEFTGGNR